MTTQTKLEEAISWCIDLSDTITSAYKERLDIVITAVQSMVEVKMPGYHLSQDNYKSLEKEYCKCEHQSQDCFVSDCIQCEFSLLISRARLLEKLISDCRPIIARLKMEKKELEVQLSNYKFLSGFTPNQCHYFESNQKQPETVKLKLENEELNDKLSRTAKNVEGLLYENGRLQSENNQAVKEMKRMINCLLELKHHNNHTIEEEVWRIEEVLAQSALEGGNK